MQNTQICRKLPKLPTFCKKKQKKNTRFAVCSYRSGLEVGLAYCQLNLQRPWHVVCRLIGLLLELTLIGCLNPIEIQGFVSVSSTSQAPDLKL